MIIVVVLVVVVLVVVVTIVGALSSLAFKIALTVLRLSAAVAMALLGLAQLLFRLPDALFTVAVVRLRRRGAADQQCPADYCGDCYVTKPSIHISPLPNLY